MRIEIIKEFGKSFDQLFPSWVNLQICNKRISVEFVPRHVVKKNKKWLINFLFKAMFK